MPIIPPVMNGDLPALSFQSAQVPDRGILGPIIDRLGDGVHLNRRTCG